MNLKYNTVFAIGSIFMNKIDVIYRWLRYNLLNRGDIVLVSESAHWVVKEITQEIISSASNNKQKMVLAYSPYKFKNKILHFTSVHALVDRNNCIREIHPSNKVILTWYHILENDPCLLLLPSLKKIVHFFHTTSSITSKKLQDAGVDPKKIILIPQGIDLKIFHPQSIEKRIAFKKKLKLPQNRCIIGSFQKDGVGWGEGNEPKLIKGPDIFCSIVEKLSKRIPIHVLLTGPARGYVKKQLADFGVSFSHYFLKNYYDIADYYNVLDLYMVTSRNEGGPRAILESMACGVPLISSQVGMAPDIICNEKNALLVDVEDQSKFIEGANRVFSDSNLKKTLVDGGLATAGSYDNKVIVQRYFSELYLV